MKKTAEFILGMCSMGVAAEATEEEHIAYIISVLGKTPDALLDYIRAACSNRETPRMIAPLAEMPEGFETEEGANAARLIFALKRMIAPLTEMPEGFETEERANAARLILALQPAGTVNNAEEHYRILRNLFRDTPEGLMYYLEDAAGTVLLT